MITYPELDPKTELPLYHERLQSDHDYRVWVDVLTLDEKLVRSVDLLDGQINVDRAADGPTRTGSLVLSDPEGALSFGTRYADDSSGVLWVNRLIRVNHSIVVPALQGRTIRAVCGVGVPTAVSRKGGELGIEWGDKSLLADHGVRPKTYKRGQNVREVLIHLLGDLCGETKFRIPPTKRTLSRPYSVGMGDDILTPWDAFVRIAKKEANWRAFYSCDGFATCEPASGSSTVKVRDLLALPDASTSFTEFVNYVKVTSTRKTVDKQGTKNTKDDVNVTTRYESVAVLPKAHDLSEQSLGRHIVRGGNTILVPRTLPLVVTDDDLKNAKEVKERARLDLLGSSGVDSEQSFEVVPLFHLDVYDRLDLPLGVGDVPFDQASIPLGTGGNMTLGSIKWVSSPVKVKRTRDRKTVRRKRSKGGKDKGKGKG